ncbi:PilZ domain-containing protein [Sphingobium sp.]|uniref:PilZ domain-containing protein n=1 Tax=Sphingobium sp. TaxID=1912891 RepID=UPI00260AB0A6|nr:PilZ domain-containing protein [Sphingobium sp.]
MTQSEPRTELSFGPARAPRHKLFEPVSLWRDGASVRGHLLDLSATGALCHSDTLFGAGDRVLIDADCLGVAGRVVWAGGKRFGLHFDAALPGPVIERVLHQG